MIEKIKNQNRTKELEKIDEHRNLVIIVNLLSFKIMIL